MSHDQVQDIANEILQMLKAQGIEDVSLSTVLSEIKSNVIWDTFDGSESMKSMQNENPGKFHRIITNYKLGISMKDAPKLFTFHFEPGDNMSYSDKCSLSSLIEAISGNDSTDSNAFQRLSTLFQKSISNTDVEQLTVNFYDIVGGSSSYHRSQHLAKCLRTTLKTFITSILTDAKNNKNNSKKLSLRNINYETVLIPAINEGSSHSNDQIIKIGTNGRIRSLEMEKQLDNSLNSVSNQSLGQGALYLKCMVYSATLRDVVELYSRFAESLFEQNLRYHIKEQNDVEDAISTTANNNPSSFWFLNNGISIVVADCARIQNNQFNQLTIDSRKSHSPNPIDCISVINGAQTISSCYNLEQIDDSAKVILRVYTFVRKDNDLQPSSPFQEGRLSESESTAIEATIDGITIALNRQKPIRPDDLAFTGPFVRNMNAIEMINGTLGDDAIPTDVLSRMKFGIVRRGEKESIFLRQYSLINFARVMKAITQNPGQARSSAASTLLKNNADNDIFIADEDDKSFVEKYREKYRSVNLAFVVLSKIDYLSQRKSNGSAAESTAHIKDMQTFIENGRYYFLAHIVKQLEQITLIDKDSEMVANKITALYDDYLNKIRDNFDLFYAKDTEADSVDSTNTSIRESFDSNDFKKNELYNQIEEKIQW
ncbi:MAG: AIPR family protein [Bifidobacterium sp.]|uniref:AIPR family protein n=1 Tax=Bifidobacterium sp. TaxID=41200 RepID=UPI0039EADCD4